MSEEAETRWVGWLCTFGPPAARRVQIQALDPSVICSVGQVRLAAIGFATVPTGGAQSTEYMCVCTEYGWRCRMQHRQFPPLAHREKPWEEGRRGCLPC